KLTCSINFKLGDIDARIHRCGPNQRRVAGWNLFKQLFESRAVLRVQDLKLEGQLPIEDRHRTFSSKRSRWHELQNRREVGARRRRESARYCGVGDEWSVRIISRARRLTKCEKCEDYRDGPDSGHIDPPNCVVILGMVSCLPIPRTT